MIVDDIKSSISIIEIAEREGLRLKKSGSGLYKSLCGFHSETKPSLTFDINKNLFRCYSCQEHGDVINFYAKKHGLSNQEAIKQLTNSTGIKRAEKGLVSPKRAEPKKKQLKLSPDGVYRALKEFCGELDPESRAYLTSQSRGLTDDTIKQFSIFSIKDYKKARQFLINKFLLEDLQSLVLFSGNKGKQPKQGTNRFLFSRHKIIIPLIENGKITAIRGRYFYKGQTEPGYHFGKYHSTAGVMGKLFNADILKTLEKGDRVYLCEGEFDTMILQQNGHNAVGLLGVGNYSDETIKRLNDFDLMVAFDDDERGRKEAEKISNIFYKQTRRVADREKLPDGIKDITELFIYKAKQNENLHKKW